MYPNTVRLIEAEKTAEDETEDGKKAGGKKGAAKKDKKGAKKGKAEEGEEKEGSGSTTGKDYEIQDIDQMGQYVFGMMKEQQQYAVQQQQAYMQSFAQPMETDVGANAEADGEQEEGGRAMEVDQE